MSLSRGSKFTLLEPVKRIEQVTQQDQSMASAMISEGQMDEVSTRSDVRVWLVRARVRGGFVYLGSALGLACYCPNALMMIIGELGGPPKWWSVLTFAPSYDQPPWSDPPETKR